ncbi:hypothetical protein LJC00_01690 [Dysgonomonas sp. OttesenSCG-928-M03]|nr:hypothetical protein [Dysgonomonas sp. OttesenSCG-928-M03]
MEKLLTLFVVIAFCLLGCKKKDQSNNIKIQNLYLETVNFSPELKACFDDYFFNRHKSDTTWFVPDTVIYYYKDASALPDKNLLDYTKKMRITLLEKDLVGNPAFSVEVFQTEKSEWRRTSNSSHNPFRVDSLLSLDELCKGIIANTSNYILKFNP